MVRGTRILIAVIVLGGCLSDQERVQREQQRLAQVAATDDAQCKSYGLQFGTPAYADCRMRIAQMRQQQQIADQQSFDATMASIQNSFPRQQTTNCTEIGNTVNCRSY